MPAAPPAPPATLLPDRQRSFVERGVALPFTAPLLAGARLRQLPGQAPEVLLPAPTGRGVYVVGWRDCVASCAPTLHDHHLWDRLARLPRPSPGGVRAAAREVAAAGLAGRAARQAAAAALGAQAEWRLRLLAELAARMGIAPPGPPWLGQLAGTLAEVGLGPRPGGLLIPRLAALERLAREGGQAYRLCGRAEVGIVVGVAIGAARLTLAAMPGSLEPLWALLARLPAATEPELLPAEAAALAERADWLLDGWDRLTALWADQRATRPEEALAEIAADAPVPAEEADAWPGAPADWPSLLAARRNLPPRPLAAPGARPALVARAERLRLRAA